MEPVMMLRLGRHQRQFHRGRQLGQDELQRGHAIDEGAAQVTAQRAAQEGEVLLVQRPVQPQSDGGAQLLGLVGLGVDQQFDRVADGVDTQEHQHRHRHQDEAGLRQTPQNLSQHQAGARSRVFTWRPARSSAR
jgi:hypothetical protein